MQYLILWEYFLCAQKDECHAVAVQLWQGCDSLAVTQLLPGSRAVEHTGCPLLKNRYSELCPWRDLETTMSFEVSRQADLSPELLFSCCLFLYSRCCCSSGSYTTSCQGTEGGWPCFVRFVVPGRGTKNEFCVEGKVEVIAMPTGIMFKVFTNGCRRLLLSLLLAQFVEEFFSHVVVLSILG